jgi:hypothetical protein
MSYKRNQIEEVIARVFAPNCEKLLRSCARASSGCLNLTAPLAAPSSARMLSRPALSNRTKPPSDGSKMPMCGQSFTRPTVSDLPKRCP